MLLFTVIQNIIICKLLVFLNKVNVYEITHIYDVQTFKEFLYHVPVFVFTASSIQEIVKYMHPA